MTNTATAQAVVDTHFARLMMRLGAANDSRLAQLFSDLSHALTTQHSCIDLTDYEDGDVLRSRLNELAIVGDGSSPTPIVLEGSRLFMAKYFRFEVRIANRLATMNAPLDGVDEARLSAVLADEFPAPDRQRLAAMQALSRRLTIIAGGPGTGKTTTVAGILRSLRALSESEMTIALAAPTGKAAMRLKASLGDLEALPEVKTLHRLLGYRPASGEYRHGPSNPLPADLVIVDEVSMVDLAMMDRLLGALHADARLILLGDPGQLPSVEAGNLLADLCKYGFPLSEAFAGSAGRIAGVRESGESPRHRLQDSLCELIDSHRFSPDRGIGRLAAAIRTGSAVNVQADEEVTAATLADLDDDALLAIYADYIELVEHGGDATTLARTFEKVQLLSPMREGEHGVTTLNERIEALLATRGIVNTASAFYHGRPVLVTKNDYNLQLYNGDIGICVGSPGGEFRVIFQAGGETREFLASRLPTHETCFAMTVHKSQGSEFDHVALALPVPATSSQAQLLTREMFYTAITRARRHVSLYFDDETLRMSLEQHTVRHSGLGERLLIDAPVGQMDLFKA